MHIFLKTTFLIPKVTGVDCRTHGKHQKITEQNKMKVKQKPSPLTINLCNMAVGVLPFFCKNAVQLGILYSASPLQAWSSVAVDISSFYLLSSSLSEPEFLTELWLTPAGSDCPFRPRVCPGPHPSLSPGDIALGPAMSTSPTSSCFSVG